MVYHGVVSKGCQRCRQRKIKCDQRKPACLKCEKSGNPCPGYRNLSDVLFRDETERVAQKAKQVDRWEFSSTSAVAIRPTTWAPPWTIVAPAISQNLQDVAANFFFTKYAFESPTFHSGRHRWMAKSYLETSPSHLLRAAIEAVGMAGFANVIHAPLVSFKAKEHYHAAVVAMKQALCNPVEAVADTTLMAVILFGLYEVVNFESWDRFQYWAAHVQGATALLQLRGLEQFDRERGAQLYIQIRSEILSVCMQQRIPVPPALVQTAYNFGDSAIRQEWQDRQVASPGSLCEISFRVVNLQAAINSDSPPGPQSVQETAIDMDLDLEDWKAGVPPAWKYSVVDVPDVTRDAGFDGKQHVYPNLWVAEVWNSWRILRLLVYQIIVHSDFCPSGPGSDPMSSPASVIRQLSTDFCISTASFAGTPRAISLIQPLYVVAVEGLNPLSVRSFAVRLLREINTSMGIRQASLLADKACLGTPS